MNTVQIHFQFDSKARKSQRPAKANVVSKSTSLGNVKLHSPNTGIPISDNTGIRG